MHEILPHFLSCKITNQHIRLDFMLKAQPILATNTLATTSTKGRSRYGSHPLHDILLVLCLDHHSLEALDGGKSYQPVRLPPEGLGVRHRIRYLDMRIFAKSLSYIFTVEQSPAAKASIFIVYRRQKYVYFIVYRRQDDNAICSREGICTHKTPTKDGKYHRWA